MDYPLSVDQIWLFGSRARSTSSEFSDTDVLVVADQVNLEELRARLKSKYGKRLDIAHYTYEGINKLVSNNSLFALHLKKEGMPIFSRSSRLKELLTQMHDYNSHTDDLGILRQLLADISDSSPDSIVFEHGILGTVVRNTGIIMTHFLGQTDFSPKAPITLGQIKADLAMPISNEDYELLQICRRSGERGYNQDFSSLSAQDLLAKHEAITRWHQQCTNYITGALQR